MGKILKRLGIFVLALLVAGGIYAAFNLKNIQRLARVNSLFAADKIVYNFSHMSEVLSADELIASAEIHEWPVALQPLPPTYTERGEARSVRDLLTELDTTALVVVKDGTIVHEEYNLDTSPQDLRISWSMSKSFVSALTGIALADGKIDSLDDPVTKYVPSLAASAYNGVSLRNVMNMASGVEFNEDYLDFKSDINKMGRVLAVGGSLDEFAASITTIAREQGTAWQYVSIDTHVISMVVRAAVGKDLQTYFEEKLWSKIGASANAYYSTDLQGNAFALGGLNMPTRDYALFGELFRNGGKRGDVQIVPADWVQASTRHTAPPAFYNHNDRAGEAPFGYGYQWWLPSNSDGEYFAVGVYGQYIYVNPKAGIVIAKNAADREFMDQVEGKSGAMYQNINMFRTIAEHYSDWEFQPED